jgi:membrane protein implicated in regulation of membrane protease activity
MREGELLKAVSHNMTYVSVGGPYWTARGQMGDAAEIIDCIRSLSGTIVTAKGWMVLSDGSETVYQPRPA